MKTPFSPPDDAPTPSVIPPTRDSREEPALVKTGRESIPSFLPPHVIPRLREESRYLDANVLSTPHPSPVRATLVVARYIRLAD